MDGRAWWSTVHGLAKSRTGLSDITFTFTNFQGQGRGILRLPLKQQRYTQFNSWIGSVNSHTHILADVFIFLVIYAKYKFHTQI